MINDNFANNNNNPKIDLIQQHLANERTFLAWVRTCIALIGLGFIISKFSFFLVEFKFIFQNYIIASSNLAANNNNNNTEVAGSEQLSSLTGIGIVIL
jgi:putative membrane protein